MLRGSEFSSVPTWQPQEKCLLLSGRLHPCKPTESILFLAELLLQVMRCKNWESSLTVKVHVAFAVLSVKRHLLKSLLSKTDGESVGKKKESSCSRFWGLWLLLGTAAQLKGVSKGNSVTSVTESLNAILLAWLLSTETRDTCTSPRKPEKCGVWYRS